MGSIHLYSKNNPDSTMVSNHFIDKYMPEANGEFVKVYLYLLRCLSTSAAKAPEVSISSIADRFNHTEKDVKRALKYWEKLNLLQLEYGEDKSLKSICITEDLQEAELAREQVSVTTAAGSKAQAPVLGTAQAVPRQDAPRQESTELPSYSTGQLEAFLQKEEIRQLIFIAEQYLGKPLSPSEVTYILFFQDELHFSAELIEYLIEYCISKGSKSFRYMKTVALAWSDAHISTIQQAKEASAAYNRNYYTVMKAFGIKGRAPAEPEAVYIRKWLEEYAFSLDIILEACNRTISSIHQPSFEYADSILKKWKSNNIRHLSDIRTLDEEHEKTKDTRKAARTKTTPETNKFNNFHQRSYDYEQLEKQLLHTR